DLFVDGVAFAAEILLELAQPRTDTVQQSRVDADDHRLFARGEHLALRGLLRVPRVRANKHHDQQTCRAASDGPSGHEAAASHLPPPKSPRQGRVGVAAPVHARTRLPPGASTGRPEATAAQWPHAANLAPMGSAKGMTPRHPGAARPPAAARDFALV